MLTPAFASADAHLSDACPCFRRAELKSAMQTMDKAVHSKEARYMSRVIRMVTKLRRMLSKAVLTKVYPFHTSH
jgi:hypothetical protein